MYAWGVFLRGAPGQLNPVPQSRNTPPDFAMIIVMIIVLAIILLFCFWGAPGIRAYCRRKICYRCPMDEPRDQSVEVSVNEEERDDFIVVTNLAGKNGQVPQGTTGLPRQQ
ncbi:hypothetical protein QE152_g6639 [Popillia japonica]|uniref:Uncharacterized protein n=1 Tax=Popillia japonica TaxID=7064 RepID=A0AAW1MJX2_POPJA